jgi:hypothetical protein
MRQPKSIAKRLLAARDEEARLSKRSPRLAAFAVAKLAASTPWQEKTGTSDLGSPA